VASELQGKKIALLVANQGVEQVELTEPLEAAEHGEADQESRPDGP
jgi:protease I